MARQMKDSGIEWIGEIPKEWEVVALKHLCTMQAGKNLVAEQIADEGAYPVYGGNGLRGYFSDFNTAGEYLLVGRQGALCGNVHQVSGQFWATEHAVVTQCSTLAYVRFLYYLIIGMNLNQYASNTAAQPGLSVSEIQNVRTCLVPFAEQRRIAAFLDRQCAEIDAVIERTKATIEEYKKLKQAVITEAVTKGVRGARKMKDSGIEWVEGIIDSWDMSRIGLHYNIVLGKMLCDKQLTEEHTLESYFCAANVHFDGVSQEQLKQMWFSPAEKDSYRVQDGDLLVVEGGAGAGGAAIVQTLEQPTYVQNSVMIVRGLMGQTNRYLRYWIECLVKKGYVDVVCNKATIPHFTKDKLATMPVPVVPVEEMEEIADYLDQKCAALDTLIAKKTALLTELETYKKSLIYEYVTGKKEV